MLLVAACGDSAPSAADAMAATETSGVPSEPDPADCEVVALEPTNELVVFDIQIRCPDPGFARNGLAIVNDDQRAFVATKYDDLPVVFEVDADGAAPLESPPERLVFPTHLAVLQDGRLAIPDITGPFFGMEGQLLLYDGSWTTRPLFSAVGRAAGIVGFDVVGQRMDVWLRVDGALERRSSASGWAPEPTALEPLTSRAAFALDAAGTPVEVGLLETADGWSLRAGADELARFDTEDSPYAVLATRLGGTELATQESFAALVGSDAGLALHRPDGEGVELPDTARVERACWMLECGNVCEENGRGLYGGTVALASTGEGTTWVAHAFAEFDVQIEQEWQSCEHGCHCEPNVTRDDSTMELRFSSYEEQGEIADVLSLKLPGIGYSDPGGNNLIHMSAGPSRFGVVVRDGDDGIRVLLLQP